MLCKCTSFCVVLKVGTRTVMGGSRPCTEERRRMILSLVVRVSVGAEAASVIEPGSVANVLMARATAAGGSSKRFSSSFV